MGILKMDSKIDFDKLKLSNPNGKQGGSYFCKLHYNGDDLHLQTPKCISKSGFPKGDKQGYIDIIVNSDSDFYNWILQFEEYIKQIIIEKQSLWFDNNLEKDDVDYLFTDSLKKYQKNTFLRTYIKKKKHFADHNTLRIFNEDDEQMDIHDFNNTNRFIGIIEINGLKFTNTSFKLDYNIKQILVLNNIEFNKCLIEKNDTISDVNKELIKKVAENEDSVAENEETEDSVAENEETEDSVAENEETEDSVAENEETKDSVAENEETKDSVAENEETKDSVAENNSDNKRTNIMDDALQEVTMLNNSQISNLETITLKNPKEIYYKIYRETYERAKDAKNLAIKTFLEAKHIKNTYMLDEIDSSDEQ
jgi:hypothetical protein